MYDPIKFNTFLTKKERNDILIFIVEYKETARIF